MKLKLKTLLYMGRKWIQLISQLQGLHRAKTTSDNNTK